ncbi:MAG: methyltransferase domain-containing protein [Clostridia bacterium]|jgi:ubiquinone/menaquinone biosynthesis C-methylase UbiE|nr:methyltransferase domain-containing protein [Clostridia bacterium]MCI1999135.1 methyltransferase domain-containing protein [Clostridia bacterium]MCI2013885.1 methyltransferase domain-containing protein [Clostridia bacterium]
MKKDREFKNLSKEYFNSIAENYDNSHDGKFVNCMYKELVERAITLKNKPHTILDLGCGNGNVIAMISQKTDADLYGIDLSEKMIKEAKKRLDKAKLCVGNAEKLPYDDNKFDVVICNASFHHYPKPEIVLQEVKRVLKKDGTFILGDPTSPVNWYLKFLNWALKFSNSGDFHIYGKKEIIKMLEKTGFTVTNLKKIDFKTFVLNAKLQ